MGYEMLTADEKKYYVKCLKEAKNIVGISGDPISDAILISAVFLRLSGR